MTVSNFICPYCYVMMTPRYVGTDVGHMFVPFSYAEYNLVWCTNPKCKQIIYVVVRDGKIQDMYPKKTPKIDTSVHEEVSKDFIESIKCFDNNCFRAAASMCRRALQSSAIDKGAEGGTLIKQIDDLHTKGIITSDLKDWAHEIRLTGNIGAHPDKDGLKEITKDDAEEIIGFMEEYLKYVYIMPKKVANKKNRRNRNTSDSIV